MASTVVVQCFWSCRFLPSSNSLFRPSALCLRMADLMHMNIYKHALLKKPPLHTILPNTNTKWNKSHARDVGYRQEEGKSISSRWRMTTTNQRTRSTSPSEAFVSCISVSCSYQLEHINGRKQKISLVHEKQLKLTLLKWEVNTFG